MPGLQFKTNVKIEDEKAFALALSKKTAEILGKPEDFIMVNIEYSTTISFAGSFEPAFLLTITADGFNPESNVKYSAAFFSFVEEKLAIPGNRGYIRFDNPGLAYIGHLGTTVEVLLAGK
ncbi:Tautomerase/MIF superfamily [Coprinopsis sp. MPI-PUGE-AT-0042]|nr:Tautomerase/MIF superfamily [Coprinopsis sp. MPI-PUGE-AT-0042]